MFTSEAVTSPAEHQKVASTGSTSKTESTLAQSIASKTESTSAQSISPSAASPGGELILSLPGFSAQIDFRKCRKMNSISFRSDTNSGDFEICYGEALLRRQRSSETGGEQDVLPAKLRPETQTRACAVKIPGINVTFCRRSIS